LHPPALRCTLISISGARRGLIGNPVGVGSGPAAVAGDETPTGHWPAGLGRQGE
jgi:hypothetical protein